MVTSLVFSWFVLLLIVVWWYGCVYGGVLLVFCWCLVVGLVNSVGLVVSFAYVVCLVIV